MTNILEFIQSMDKIVEGFGAPDNLLYGPEIKFYSNKVKINDRFETSVKGLYSIGDGGGMTRRSNDGFVFWSPNGKIFRGGKVI